MGSLGSRLGLVLLLATSSCENRRECDDARSQALSERFDVKVVCDAAICRARLSAAEAKRLANGLGKNESPVSCEVSALPDAKSSSAALMGDPCCTAGGSACMHFYEYVISESGRMLCVKL